MWVVGRPGIWDHEIVSSNRGENEWQAATFWGVRMEDPRVTARWLVEQHVLTLEELWVRYWANGGRAGEQELDAYVYGALEPYPLQVAIIGWALEDFVGG